MIDIQLSRTSMRENIVLTTAGMYERKEAIISGTVCSDIASTSVLWMWQGYVGILFGSKRFGKYGSYDILRIYKNWINRGFIKQLAHTHYIISYTHQNHSLGIHSPLSLGIHSPPPLGIHSAAILRTRSLDLSSSCWLWLKLVMMMLVVVVLVIISDNDYGSSPLFIIVYHPPPTLKQLSRVPKPMVFQ